MRNEFKSIIEQVESEQDAKHNDMDVRVAKFEKTIDQMESFKNTKEMMNQISEEIKLEMKDLNDTRKDYDKKIDKIYKTHLIREDIIGDDHDAEDKTLIDFVLRMIPDLKSRIRKTDD